MRPIYRYGYPLQRFYHHLRNDFQVWRQNREVADAFRDPILEGPGTLAVLAKPLRSPWVSWVAAGLAVSAALGLIAKAKDGHLSLGSTGMAWSGLSWKNWIPESDGAASLSEVPASAEVLTAPTAPLPPSLPSATVAASAPISLSAPLPDLGGPVADVPDPASQGVNMAIMRVTAGLDPESDPVPTLVAAKLPERYNALVACKRERTLYVYERKSKGVWSRLAAFPMAFGRKVGDKADAGDRRTPEGRYWITSLLSGPMQGPLYGPLVFTLNYPTPRDLADGKSGEHIWIHGVEAGKYPTRTHGCLALPNAKVLELAKYADVGTPVLILADTVLADPARQFDETGMEREYPALMAEHSRRSRSDTLKLEKVLAEARAFLRQEARDYPEAAAGGLSPEDKEAILTRLDRWKEDWSNRDADAYARNYAAEFKDKQGRALGDFLERKRQIFASKTRISMEVDGPAIEPEGYGKANVTFRQEYAAEGRDGIQRSSGSKTVWLERGPDGWLIIKE